MLRFDQEAPVISKPPHGTHGNRITNKNKIQVECTRYAPKTLQTETTHAHAIDTKVRKKKTVVNYSLAQMGFQSLFGFTATVHDKAAFNF